MLEVPQIEIILYKCLSHKTLQTNHLRMLLCQFLSLLDDFFNGTHHVESLLWQGIIFTLKGEKNDHYDEMSTKFTPLRKYLNVGATLYLQECSGSL